MGRISPKNFFSLGGGWFSLTARDARLILRSNRESKQPTKMFRKRMRSAKIEAMMHIWTAKYRAKRAVK